jgi:hypothetical protein
MTAPLEAGGPTLYFYPASKTLQAKRRILMIGHGLLPNLPRSAARTFKYGR